MKTAHVAERPIGIRKRRSQANAKRCEPLAAKVLMPSDRSQFGLEDGNAIAEAFGLIQPVGG